MTSPTLEDLRRQLAESSAKKQLQTVSQLVELGESGCEILLDYLQANAASPTPVTGKIYQTLLPLENSPVQEGLQEKWPEGIVETRSQRAIDYQPLQIALARQEFQQSDRLTLKNLCELAGEGAVARKWLYFTEVEGLPSQDLQTIDTLWRVYSENKFGYSIQREIWLSLGKNFDKLWEKIDWKKGNLWTRYPNEFTWNLSAPRGHLPLSNQLRGVRPFASLMNHPAWVSEPS